MNNRRADMAHPAFAKLFVETEYDQATGAIFARRRPRDAKEKPIWGVHVSASSQGSSQAVEYETDRAKFLGRGRTPANPAIFDKRTRPFGTTGPVLDPIFCLRRTSQSGAGESARLAFVTGAGEDERRSRQSPSNTQASMQSTGHSLRLRDRYRAELQDLQLTPDDVSLFNRLDRKHCIRQSEYPAGRWISEQELLDRSALWSHGISGDLPNVAGSRRMPEMNLSFARSFWGTTSAVAEVCDLTLSCLTSVGPVAPAIGRGTEGEFQSGVRGQTGRNLCPVRSHGFRRSHSDDFCRCARRSPEQRGFTRSSA